MFNVPAFISAEMDLAMMLAKIELVESLVDDNFKVYRQARVGLASFPTNLYQAKGQLKTKMVSGSLYAYDDENNKIISEKERIEKIMMEYKINK